MELVELRDFEEERTGLWKLLSSVSKEGDSGQSCEEDVGNRVVFDPDASEGIYGGWYMP